MAAIHVRAGLRSLTSTINALAFFANCDPRIVMSSGM